MKRLKTLGDAQDARFVLIATALVSAVLFSGARAQACPPCQVECQDCTCEAEGDCPPEQQCPVFRCPFQLQRCVIDLSECEVPCPAGQFECSPGECLLEGQACPAQICLASRCPCPDGRCVIDSSECEVVGNCPAELPVECQDCTCEADVGNCPPEQQCPVFRCPFQLQRCVIDLSECEVPCPAGQFECRPGECLLEGQACPAQICLASRCPCPDGRCVIDSSECGCAAIDVRAAMHTIGSGSNPGSTKDPLVGIEVCAYDKADGSCSRVCCGGISHQHYECIVAGCDPVKCCTTDANGECTINLPEGDYIVISADATKTVLPDPLGVSASDLICGEVKQKHLQQIVKPRLHESAKKTPGKTTRLTGSELLIIEPEYVIWDGTVQEYPFVFETVGDWGVTAAVSPPEGFVSDYDSLSADVYNEIEAVQFTITEVGSDLVPTGTTFEVTHRGRREVIHSQIGIFLTPEYAQSRGFNVAVLRAQGLIKERPGNQGQGDEHRR